MRQSFCGMGRALVYYEVMHSELFSLFGITVQSYGLSMAMGFILCYLSARRMASATGRIPEQVDAIVMIAALCGVVGARIIYVIQNWTAEFADAPMNMFMVWKGGLVFYGGFLLVLAGLAAYARMHREPIRGLLDFCSVFLPLGQAFGRLGCFMHGCCFGGFCTVEGLGVRFPKGSPAWLHQVAAGDLPNTAAISLPVWPTQLIESVGCLILFGILWKLYRAKRTCLGLTAGIYGIGYAVLRFVGECFRDDPRGAQILGLSFSQCISVGVLLAGAVLILFSFKKKEVC